MKIIDFDFFGLEKVDGFRENSWKSSTFPVFGPIEHLIQLGSCVIAWFFPFQREKFSRRASERRRFGGRAASARALEPFTAPACVRRCARAHIKELGRQLLSSTTFGLANSRYKRNAVQQHGVFLVSVFAEGLVDRLLVCLGTEEDDEVEDHVDDEELRQHGLHEGEASTVPAEDAGYGDRDEGQREVDGGGAGEREGGQIH